MKLSLVGTAGSKMNPSFFLWFPVNSKSGSFHGLAHSPSPGRYSDPFLSA